MLSAKLGLSAALGKPSNAIPLRAGVSLPMPGAHAALLHRLYGGKKSHANPK